MQTLLAVMVSAIVGYLPAAMFDMPMQVEIPVSLVCSGIAYVVMIFVNRKLRGDD